MTNSWTADDIAANTTNAQNLDVSFVSGDVIFETVTDGDGNFTIIVPGDLSYVMKAATTANSYGVGQIIAPNSAADIRSW